MATQGLVSATAVTLLLCILISFKITDAATYMVGDSAGWNFGVVDWPTGKTFHKGDKLVFKYEPSVHNLVMVDIHGYEECSVIPPDSKIHTSGNDTIELEVEGHNYFICTFPGHCEKQMKIDINVT